MALDRRVAIARRKTGVFRRPMVLAMTIPFRRWRGLYARNRVYEGVTGMEAFDPWIRRAKNFTDRVLEEFAKEVPPEWYYDDFDALSRLLEQLLRRVNRLEELILDAKRSNRQPFPNWR